jgi:hypothetical protein
LLLTTPAARRRREYERIREQQGLLPPLAPGDVDGVMERLRTDFERAYFVTGERWSCALELLAGFFIAFVVHTCFICCSTWFSGGAGP